MCVGKTNRRVPDSAKAQAEFARSQARTHERLIQPLEQAEADQLGNESYQKARGTILEGRANADAAGAERQSQRSLRSGMGQLGEGNFTNTNLASGEINSSSQESRTKGVLAGYNKGQSMTLGDRFDALKTGQGHARGVTSGLGAASRNEMVAQEADAQGEMMVGNALGGLAVTAGMGGYSTFKRAGDSEVPTADLSLLGRGLRGMGYGQSQAGLYQQPQGPQNYGVYQPNPTNNPNSLPGSQNTPDFSYQGTNPAPIPKFQSFKNWISGN
jgi:hypothetical protein